MLVGLIAGFILFKKLQMPLILQSQSKIESVLTLINSQYVDTVNIDALTEDAITGLIRELDPHSVYIPAKDIESVNEELEGSFSGIGVQFSIQHDTILIVQVIPGGPSEKAGLLAGDKIVEVNDTLFVGKEVTNERVMKRLRGAKRSKVKLGIKRSGTKELLSYHIERGDIPVKSVEAFYMITPQIGYIKISKFGRTTYDEFITAIASLKSQKAHSFIIDLRENSGGYLEAAARMINEFLPANQLIVYTQGKAYPRDNSISNGIGSCISNPVVILQDEMSASASEIFSGAIQDNDRGLIIGRRSFGKGLVQNQLSLQDGSALRLTIARYYTPSGRSIQKPYTLGAAEQYEMDLANRYIHGEFFNQDSIKQQDTVAYYTSTGRVVYGGGGIMPDIFIPRDTSGYSPYYRKLINSSALYEYALLFTEQNRTTLKEKKTTAAMTQYLDQKQAYSQMIEFAQAQKKIQPNDRELSRSKSWITKQLYALIARNVQGENMFYQIWNSEDPEIKQAIKHIQSGKCKFPIHPTPKEK